MHIMHQHATQEKKNQTIICNNNKGGDGSENSRENMKAMGK